MIALATYLQGIATLRPDPSVIVGIQWHFIAHMLLGMTIFLLLPFSRLVHVGAASPRWRICSGPISWCARAA